MEITIELFKKRFPEFTLTDDTHVQFAMIEANVMMGTDPNRWGDADNYLMAKSYLVAHLVSTNENAMAGDDNALSPVRRTAVDNVEIDYAVNTNYAFMDSELATTIYGRRYMFYRSLFFFGGISV